MNVRRLLAGVAVVCAVAAPVLAGGLNCRIRSLDARFALNADGVVSMRFEVGHEPCCFQTIFVPADSERLGPDIRLERREGEKWVAAGRPWITPEKMGNEPGQPSTPYRLDAGMTLAFSRSAKLALGTYRVIVEVTAKSKEHGIVHDFHSQPFEVVSAKPSKGTP